MQERLVVRRPSTKGMEADSPGTEIHLATDQALDARQKWTTYARQE
jgi:hypothetical protein